MVINRKTKTIGNNRAYTIEANDISYNQVLCVIRREDGCNAEFLYEILCNEFDMGENGYKVVSLSSKNSQNDIFYYIVLEERNTAKKIE